MEQSEKGSAGRVGMRWAWWTLWLLPALWLCLFVLAPDLFGLLLALISLAGLLLVAAAVLPRRGAGNPASEVRRGALTLRGECLFRAPAEPKWSVIFRLRFLRYGIIEAVKTTLYFEGKVLENPERRGITVELCERIVSEAEHAEEQRDGRFRFWGYVPERQMYLRVIASGDREVLINAFFDSNFTRKQRRSR